MPAETPLRTGRPGEAGLTLIEAAIGTLLSLVVLLGVYQTMDWGQKSFSRSSEGVSARTTGRAVLDLLATDIMVAGYNPLGATFNAIPSGTATQVRILSDRDGDGRVGIAGEVDENLTWLFVAYANGNWELRRGIDLNGDGDFVDTGESVESAAYNVVQIDANGDGTLDPFLTYDVAPPLTTRIHLNYGLRHQTRDATRRRWEVVPFQSDIALRNRILQ